MRRRCGYSTADAANAMMENLYDACEGLSAAVWTAKLLRERAGQHRHIKAAEPAMASIREHVRMLQTELDKIGCPSSPSPTPP